MTSYLYICSAARSGSTLLDMLIGGHSKAASLGEFSFLGKAVSLEQTCGCGEKVNECEYWTMVFNKINRERGINMLNAPYSLRQWDTNASTVIDFKQQTPRYLKWARFRSLLCLIRYSCPKALRIPLPSTLSKGTDNSIYLYETILEQWSKDFVIDSSKNMNKALALYEKSPGKTKIILLTRDGRGVFHSRYSSGFTKEQSLLGWKKYYSRAFKLLSKNVKEQDLLIVKYEDLASDLEGVLRTICDFVGIEFEHAMINLELGQRHLVNGNNTMHKREKGVKLDQRWLSDLSSQDLKWFMDRAAGLNEELGYK